VRVGVEAPARVADAHLAEQVQGGLPRGFTAQLLVDLETIAQLAAHGTHR
jgi:hypothetical protein